MVDGVPTALEWVLAMGEADFLQCGPPRGHRFGIGLPVLYRACGETKWHEGRTENISHTGVFFRGDWLMDVQSQVEMSFEVLLGTGGETLAEIVCHAEIVRMVLPATLDAQPGLAARILEYRFVQAKTGPVV